MAFQGPVTRAPELKDLTPAQRLRAIRATRDLAEGKVQGPPLRCGKCASPVSHVEDGELLCWSCGAHTNIKAAHKVRRQAIRAWVIQVGLGTIRPKAISTRRTR